MRKVIRAVTLLGLVVVATVSPHTTADAIRVPQTQAHRVAHASTAVRPGFSVDYVGVLWDVAPADGREHHERSHGAVRFRHGGVWDSWIPLVEDGAERAGQWASGLVAGDGAEAYEVRGLPADAVNPRTVALNTTDGPLATTGLRRADAAQAVDGCMSRAEWGADESLRYDDGGSEIWPPEFHEPQVMTVHHTATGNDDPDPAATVRAIYEYHAVDRGWGDIGYQLLVDEAGGVYEGRWSGAASLPCSEGGSGRDFAHEDTNDNAAIVTGAHTGGWNSGNFGVALLGEFTTHPRFGTEPNPAAVDALVGVLTEFADRHAIDPEAMIDYVNPVSRDTKTVEAIAGHRDYSSTECPGERLYDDLPDIRAAVAALMPAVSVALSAPIDGATVSGTVAVSARAVADAGVTQVEFAVNGSSIGVDTDGSDGWSASWDTGVHDDGTANEVSATATDSGGNQARAAVTVTVDDSSPTVHVGDLDASSTDHGRVWTAHVTVTIVDIAGDAVADATVAGLWDTNSTGTTTDSCTTGASGTCQISLSGIHKSDASARWTVNDVTGEVAYDPAANNDRDADSDGTTIIVHKP